MQAEHARRLFLSLRGSVEEENLQLSKENYVLRKGRKVTICVYLIPIIVIRSKCIFHHRL
jgi:hypothetical protein